MSELAKTMGLGDIGDLHEVGNLKCEEGRCGSYGFPKVCDCGGLIHASFGDESSDGDFWFYERCDKCGDRT